MLDRPSPEHLVHELNRALVADRAVSSLFVAVSTPSLAFSTGVVEGQELGRVQAFGPDLAVAGFGEGVVSRLAEAAEVQCHAVLEGP